MRVVHLATLVVGCACGAQAVSQVPDIRHAPARDLNTRIAPPVYGDREAWLARRTELREQVLNAAGLLPMPPRPPLTPQVTDRRERAGYSVERVWFETAPGLVLGGNLYRPLGRSGPRYPAVLTPHGHMAHGRLHNDDLFSPPGRSINFARQGYVVFSYDMLGYNDTGMGLEHRKFGTGAQPPLWGVSVFGLQTWNSLRALDFLLGLPDVDPQRVGITGESGGGTQTFILTAIDDRFTVAAPVNMVSLQMQGGCLCENAPGLRLDTNNVELAAMAAPKPMLMVSATGDWTVNTPRLEGPAVRAAYELFGAADRLAWVQMNAGHNYNRASREAVYAFFGKWLLADPEPEHFREQPFQVEAAADLRVFAAPPPRQLGEAALTASLVAARRAQWQADLPTDAASLPTFQARWAPPLRHSLGVRAPRPADVTAQRDGERLALSWRGQQARLGLTNAHAPTAVVLAGGSAAWVEALAAGGRAVLSVEPFAYEPPRDPRANFYTGYNRTALACQVQDLLTTLAYARQAGYRRVELVGLGRQGLRALLALGVAAGGESGDVAGAVCDLDGLDPERDAAWEGELWQPGLRRAGDVRTAALLSARGALWLAGARAVDVQPLRRAFEAAGGRLRASAEAPTAHEVVAWLGR